MLKEWKPNLKTMSRNNSTSRRACSHERCFRHLVETIASRLHCLVPLRLRPAAGGRACGMPSRTTSPRPWPPTGGWPCWLSGGDTCSSACPEVLLYASRRLADGPDWLRVVARSFRLPALQPHSAHRPAPPTHPLTREPITSPDRAAHTPAGRCGFRQDPPPRG